MSDVGILPHTWCDAKISEITSVNPTLNKADISDDLDISFVPMPAVQAESGIIDVTGIRKFSEVKKGYTSFREGDVLFAKITPCMENGKMAVVPEVINGIGFGSTEFHVLRALSGVNAKYVYYYVSSQGFRREAEHNMSGAVGQRRVTTPYLSACEIPLPPTNEQHRIVAKIEELFSELDKGIENLKTARAQLKVYRQALLKHAFEGKLTAQWRKENQDKLETADALLKRIQQERAQRYQQQLADWAKSKSPSVPLLQSGKTSRTATPPLVPHFAKGGLGGISGIAAGLSKPKAPKPLPPLTAEELAELPELPEGWGWFAMGNICQESILGKMLDKEKNKGELKPYLRNINVRWGKFDLDDLLEMRFEESEYVRFGLVDGDLVICEGGEPGRCAVWRKELGQDMQIQKALHRVRFTNSINSFFVQMYFELCASNRRLEKMFTGTTIKHLTGEKLARMAIPICAIEEQVQILLSLESKFSEVDRLDQTIATSLQQAEALRQSILKKAFSGQLVPQDPHDEPASALLARIKAERADVVAKPRKNISSKLVNVD